MTNEEQAANIGITNALGHSEIEILDILWRCGEATVREVYEEIRKSRNVTLPAVMLSMERLTKRGVIQKSMGNRAAVYKPKVTREAIGYGLVSDVISKVLEGSTGAVVSHLLGRLSEKELKQVMTAIRDREKSKPQG